MKTQEITTHKEYIDSTDPRLRPLLAELHKLISEVCPEADEVISYGIPIFKYYYHLVGIGTTKKDISFYCLSTESVTRHKHELEATKVNFSGSTIHFSPKHALPHRVIEAIVLYRMEENEARQIAKDLKV